MYWVNKHEREKGYDKGYSNGYNNAEKCMADKIKELSECQKKIKRIKEIYEKDKPFKALEIKKIIYEDVK